MPIDKAQMSRFAGKYELGIVGWHAAVTQGPAGLQFELPSPPMKLPLMHVGGNRFVSLNDPYGYQLTFSPDGRRLELLGMGLMEWYGRKVE